MTPNHRARLQAIEEDLREQAIGAQDGFMLEIANRLAAIISEDAASWAERQRIHCPD